MDISFIGTLEGWLYVATVIDVASRRKLPRITETCARERDARDACLAAVSSNQALVLARLGERDEALQLAREELEIAAAQGLHARSVWPWARWGLSREGGRGLSIFKRRWRLSRDLLPCWSAPAHTNCPYAAGRARCG